MSKNDISFGLYFGNVYNYQFGYDIINAEANNLNDSRMQVRGLFISKPVSKIIEMRLSYTNFSCSGIPIIIKDRRSYAFDFLVNSFSFDLKFLLLNKFGLKVGLISNLTMNYQFYHVYEFSYPNIKELKIRDEFYFGTSPGISIGVHYPDSGFGIYLEVNREYIIENNKFKHYGNILKLMFQISFKNVFRKDYSK
ncbi:hypothetical protein KAU33_09945 [Candidatus Dependentiae bacterium]|nr:hypothetical protein [Candidatus Dependentiae bacterium]